MVSLVRAHSSVPHSFQRKSRNEFLHAALILLHRIFIIGLLVWFFLPSKRMGQTSGDTLNAYIRFVSGKVL